MQGTYKFARYRSSTNRSKRELPIVSGVTVIYPYDEKTGVVRFKDAIPRPDFKETGPDNVNPYSGIVIPYGDFVFLIGDEEEGGFPILLALQTRSPKRQELLGMVLRRHPSGPVLASKVAYKRLDEERGYTKVDSAGDPYDTYLQSVANTELFLTEDEFEKQFNRPVTEIRNFPDADFDAGVLEIAASILE